MVPPFATRITTKSAARRALREAYVAEADTARTLLGAAATTPPLPRLAPWGGVLDTHCPPPSRPPPQLSSSPQDGSGVGDGASDADGQRRRVVAALSAGGGVEGTSEEEAEAVSDEPVVVGNNHRASDRGGATAAAAAPLSIHWPSPGARLALAVSPSTSAAGSDAEAPRAVMVLGLNASFAVRHLGRFADRSHLRPSLTAEGVVHPFGWGSRLGTRGCDALGPAGARAGCAVVDANRAIGFSA